MATAGSNNGRARKPGTSKSPVQGQHIQQPVIQPSHDYQLDMATAGSSNSYAQQQRKPAPRLPPGRYNMQPPMIPVQFQPQMVIVT